MKKWCLIWAAIFFAAVYILLLIFIYQNRFYF